MVTVLEHEFFLSEILDRRVFAKTKRIGRLSDLAIIETGKLPEVTQVVVDRPYGYPALTIPWDKVILVSNHEVVLDIADFHRLQGDVADFKALLLGGPKFDDDVADVFAEIEAERKADVGRAVDFGAGR